MAEQVFQKQWFRAHTDTYTHTQHSFWSWVFSITIYFCYLKSEEGILPLFCQLYFSKKFKVVLALMNNIPLENSVSSRSIANNIAQRVITVRLPEVSEDMKILIFYKKKKRNVMKRWQHKFAISHICCWKMQQRTVDIFLCSLCRKLDNENTSMMCLCCT